MLTWRECWMGWFLLSASWVQCSKPVMKEEQVLLKELTISLGSEDLCPWNKVAVQSSKSTRTGFWYGQTPRGWAGQNRDPPPASACRRLVAADWLVFSSVSSKNLQTQIPEHPLVSFLSYSPLTLFILLPTWCLFLKGIIADFLWGEANSLINQQGRINHSSSPRKADDWNRKT